MPFAVLQPPRDEQAFAELGKEIVQSARRLEIRLDVEGFLMAWVNGTRVIVEKANDGTVIGMALVTIGKRWVPDDYTATVLESKGSEELLEFVKQIAQAMGASSLFVQTGRLSESPEKTTFEVTEFHLG